MKCPKCGSENVSNATAKKVDVGLYALLRAKNQGGIAYICRIECKDCGEACVSVSRSRGKAIKGCIEEWESGDATIKACVEGWGSGDIQ